MTEDTHRFKAVIAGKTYTIVGQATDEHMRAVTEVLNEQFTQLKQLSPNMSKEDNPRSGFSAGLSPRTRFATD
ncbi:cell division protein ZapA [Levilactobacillus brevis]|nr:cell division protein ZapA [Levilactobacillus brevis]